jgi:hypothetical protein
LLVAHDRRYGATVPINGEITRRRLAVLVASALLAACGGGGGDGAGKQVASTPTGASTPSAGRLRIVSPAEGDVVPSSAELDETRGAHVAVSGTAKPDSTITIASGCTLAACSATITADSSGTFSTGVSASVSTPEHKVTITATYGDFSDNARVTITIGPEGDEPSATETATPRRKRHKTRQAGARSTATPLPAVTVTPPSSTAAPGPTTSSGGSGKAGSVVVIGDSLAQGMQPYMTSVLPGWKVSTSARIGRPLSEGMQIFNATDVTPGTVYAFSLFTNDDPRSVPALDAAVRESVRRGGCAIWSTIVRPPVGGVSYDAANRKLKQLAASLGGRLQLVDWESAVASHPQWVSGSDGVHATPEGYRNRATLYGQAIQRCA